MAKHIDFGKKGEALACEFLARKNFGILATNFRFEKGEIDVIARQKETIVFIEVKTRNSNRFGRPEESVSESKKAKLKQTALAFLEQQKLENADFRFDVIAITFEKGTPEIYHIEDAFFH